MRRMRDIWYYFLFAVPAVAAVLGVRYFIQKHHEYEMNIGVMKPSVYRNETGKLAAVQKEKEASSKTAKPSQGGASRSTASVSAPIPAAISNPAPSVAEKVASAVSEGKTTSDDGSCRSFEYRGDSPDHIVPDRGEWQAVMDQFHDVKADLVAWLEHRKSQFGEKTFAHMIDQVINLRIQRPPTMEEPDLSWRGVGVFSRGAGGASLLRLGGGFIKLAKKDPARAKFELARIIAQSWAPCELKKASMGEPWKELIGCLKVNEDHACSTGTYSEAGWAVSSVVAWVIEPPGCTLPALKDPQVASCMETWKPTATAGHRPGEGTKIWKEARR